MISPTSFGGAGGGVDTDEKSKVSSNDTTAGYLNGKLVAGTNVTLTENNDGGNETLTIAATVPVTSVNTKTGAVTLTNTDVGAAATSHTHAASDVTSGVFATARLASSGTASASTYLRGDQTWAAVSSGGLTGTNYVYVAADGTALQNGTALLNAYTTAKTKSPSATNRITVICAPGNYDLGSTTLTLDTAYIDLVSLDGNRSIVFSSSNSLGTISVTANNVMVVGVDTYSATSKSFSIATNLSNLVVRNCLVGGNSFNAAIVSGSFYDIDALGGLRHFGSNGTSTVSGTFVNCNVPGGNAFAGEYYSGSVASGVFKNCSAGSTSFGGELGTASGTFTYCKIGDYSCGSSSSGATKGATGIFMWCEAGDGTFGAQINAGKLYWCRKTVGTFATVASGGRVYYCVDGNGNVNNQ